ncbi:MAG: class I tRNA ligase family protein [Candidatus Nanopusillus sp.]|nr:class I tRNA ligase family protein [Candidatus Nanopusillus sp.]MCG2868559.1 class I tRNA ligase family protein [Candidatus Nanopusillus sp.]MCG2883138.1 class I tRNA ligase family protein [Candidatus Nanopusillus sp.]
MDKRPDYKIIEKEILDLWNKNKEIFRFNINDDKRYIIDTPPPFTSGEAHMGHALEFIWIDFLARYKRLEGYNVFFPLGFDCHGLPTELKVINKLKISKENREQFIKACIDWTNKMIESMYKTFERLGSSFDRDKVYKTIDRKYEAFVQYTLIKMLNDGLIERKRYPIMWCPKCQTAISMQEAGYLEKEGYLIYIKLPTNNGKYILIATTRPELINSCSLILIAKNKYVETENNLIVSKIYAEKNNLKIIREYDYKELENIEVTIPLINRKVKIISDNDVDYNFGTGIVWVCTYGDPHDIKWKEKYNLPEIISVSEDGRIISNINEINGLKVEEAREKIKEILKDYIYKIEKIKHNVLSHTERSDCLSPLEFIPKEQFFIKIRDLKEKILEWQKNIKIIPESEVKRLIDWINNIDQDWNISRTKMIWGLAFPFYEKDGKIYPVNIEDLPIDPRIDKEKIKKYDGKFFEDETVDVWIESSITPLIILYYALTENKEFNPKELPELFNKIKEYLPVDLRQQGYEIIRTWLFDTIVRVNLLTNKSPWKYALIHGMVLDEKGRKMSKSLGNAIDPNEIMDKYSPDALRYWALLAAPGNDYRFSIKDIESGQAFIIKLWNIGRYIEMNIKEKPEKILELKDEDKEIIKSLEENIKKSKEYIDQFRYSEYVKLWRKFTWEDFANNYLEKIKERIKNNDKTAKYLLYTIYKIILIMLHPVFPYITEYIYQQLYRENKLIIENKINEIKDLLT